MHKREKYISNRWYVDKYVNTIYSCVKTMRKKIYKKIKNVLTLCDTDDIISKLTRGKHWVVELVSCILQTWLYRYCFENKLKKLWKKFLTNAKHFDRINKLSQDRELKIKFKKIKKCLTNEQRFDKINKLSQESENKEHW